jgi:hypothetical protein
MKKLIILLGIAGLIIAFNCACSEKRLDRTGLIEVMDQYLIALVKHDPAGVPFAGDVKLVENIEPTPIGEGLWRTATGGPTDFKIYVADPVTESVGFMGVIENEGKPVLLGARLKLENDEITEIDHMFQPIDGDLPEGLIKPRPGLVEKLEESEKVSREVMLQAALGYYAAIEQSDGTAAPFADQCQRHEGGVATAHDLTLTPPDEIKDINDARSYYRRMKCGEQLDTGIMAYITDINQTRPVAIDEDMGLVMIYSMFNHDGNPNPLPIINIPGFTERDNEWGEFTVPAAHIFRIRNGEIHEIEAIGIVGVPYLAGDGWSCNRQCLSDKMDQYLEALAGNDPAGLPLAEDVQLVENAEKIPIGEGLWKTATGGPSDFTIIVADPDGGEVAFMGVIEENEKPTIAAIRLKVMDHQIKEIDHLVLHSGDEPLHPNMSEVRPALLERQPKLERVPRQRMIEIANSYYEALVGNDGDLAPFADECQRRENGDIGANDPSPLPAGREVDASSILSRMKCGEQISTGMWSYITDITDRRILAVDEAKGLVFAFSIFRHDGEPKVMEITGVPGVTELPNNWGVFDLPAAHVFKIRNGKIHEIEAIGYIGDAGITNGW